MAESRLRDLSIEFAVKIIKMCDGIKGHHSLVNQLERSSTSIGANIHEANYAHGKGEFKMTIIKSCGAIVSSKRILAEAPTFLMNKQLIC